MSFSLLLAGWFPSKPILGVWMSSLFPALVLSQPWQWDWGETRDGTHQPGGSAHNETLSWLNRLAECQPISPASQDLSESFYIPLLPLP